RSSPHTIFFLIASAIFRDGLAAVFTFGGVIAAGTFGFSLSQVIVFAIAGNVVAALGAVGGGVLDDRVGPKNVIVWALSGLIVAAAAIFVLGAGDHVFFGSAWTGDTTFWVFGLLLCLFVGPAQSSSRAYLARLAPRGEEGEFFGLYATTGWAVCYCCCRSKPRPPSSGPPLRRRDSADCLSPACCCTAGFRRAPPGAPGSAFDDRAVEVLVAARGGGPTLALITVAVFAGAVRVLCRRGQPEEAQLADLGARPQLDRQCCHVGELKRHMSGKAGIDEAGRRVGQQTQPPQRGLALQPG